MHEHILSSFNHSLDKLRGDVLAMASMARKNLASAMRGLLERDTDLCNAAIAAEVEDAVAWAEQSPYPDPATLLDDVYENL